MFMMSTYALPFYIGVLGALANSLVVEVLFISPPFIIGG